MNLRYPSASFRTLTYRGAALAFALMAGAACSDDKTPTAAATPLDVKLSESVVTLVRLPGTTPTKQVSVEVTGTSNQGVTWTSNNPSIATVTQAGVITGVADGTTFITVRSAEDPTKNRSVVVNVVSTIVTTTPATVASYVGGPTRQLTATVENNPNTAVTWSSSNPAVATVSSTGVVTPVATGTVEISAVSVADPAKRGTTTFIVDPALNAAFTTAVAPNTNVTIEAATGVDRNFHFVAPLNATSATVTLSGGSGDPDLWAYRGDASAATLATYNAAGFLCRSWNVGTGETCGSFAVQPGRVYYIKVDAYEGYSNVTLRVTTQ